MIIKKLKDSLWEDVQQLIDDKHYVVDAILLGEQTKFLIEDDDIFSFPFFVPANDVEVVNGAVSAHWRYASPLDRTEKCSSRSVIRQAM